MKIAICGDIHISKCSSLIQSRGAVYSTRIENCIKSLNWFENLALEHGCDTEVFLGDTFDKSALEDEVITALREIKWNSLCRPVNRYFLVGNHESAREGLEFSTTDSLSNMGNVLPFAGALNYDTGLTLLFLPYFTEYSRESFSDYVKRYVNEDCKKLIVFSHNCLNGVQYGAFLSKEGFDIDDISTNCDLFINGHLHNGSWVVKDKILNLGILTGQDFKEDATKYAHQVCILDTDTMKVEFFENPYAFNFYKLNIDTKEDLEQLERLKSNAIVSVKCDADLTNEVKDIIKRNTNIVEHRVITAQRLIEVDEVDKVEDFNIDHLVELKGFCKQKLGDSEILEQELTAICS